MKAFLLSLLLLSLQARACLNDYVPNEKAIRDSQALVTSLLAHDLKEPWPAREQHLRGVANPTLEEQNDLAVAMLHNGKVQEAIPILEHIEAEVPGRYQTATNLGTAYELAGQNEKALWWIQEGIRRNPRSHEGSEWIHVAVLEKKIEFAKTGWPTDLDSILGINVGLARLPVGNNGEPLTLEQVIAGLRHQLHERIPFVPPPDYCVAALLLDLGRLYQRAKGDQAASAGVYKLAMRYAGSHTWAPPEIEAFVSSMRLYQAKSPMVPIQIAFLLSAIWLLLVIPWLLANCFLYRRNLPIRSRAQLRLLAWSSVFFVGLWLAWLFYFELEGSNGFLSMLLLGALAVLASSKTASAFRIVPKQAPLAGKTS